MSEDIRLRCLKCRVISKPEDLHEEASDDEWAIAEMLCPECHGSNFVKAPPERLQQ